MESVLTIVSVIIALCALWQTHKQIKLSNKHQLFDRRLEKYLFIKRLCSVYSGAKGALDNETVINMPLFSFGFLTNTSGLEDVYTVIETPLNEAEQTLFLKKIEYLQSISEESRMIWTGKEAETVSNFILYYSELLIKLYQQEVAYDTLKDKSVNFNTSDDFIKSQLKETAKKTKLLETIDELNDLYNEIESKELLEKIKKQTQLIKVVNK